MAVLPPSTTPAALGADRGAGWEAGAGVGASAAPDDGPGAPDEKPVGPDENPDVPDEPGPDEPGPDDSPDEPGPNPGTCPGCVGDCGDVPAGPGGLSVVLRFPNT